MAALVVGADGRRSDTAVRVGRVTAAEAEYRAILLGLEPAGGVAEIELRSDSKPAIERLLSGDGPPEVIEAAGAFSDVRWVWRRRAANEAVDALVRRFLWPVRLGAVLAGGPWNPPWPFCVVCLDLAGYEVR